MTKQTLPQPRRTVLSLHATRQGENFQLRRINTQHSSIIESGEKKKEVPAKLRYPVSNQAARYNQYVDLRRMNMQRNSIAETEDKDEETRKKPQPKKTFLSSHTVRRGHYFCRTNAQQQMIYKSKKKVRKDLESIKESYQLRRLTKQLGKQHKQVKLENTQLKAAVNKITQEIKQETNRFRRDHSSCEHIDAQSLTLSRPKQFAHDQAVPDSDTPCEMEQTTELSMLHQNCHLEKGATCSSIITKSRITPNQQDIPGNQRW